MFSFGLVIYDVVSVFHSCEYQNSVEEACFEGKMAVCFSFIYSIVLILVVEECP